MSTKRNTIAYLIQERQLAEKHLVGTSLAVHSLRNSGSFKDELAVELLLQDAANSRRVVEAIERAMARYERQPELPMSWLEVTA